MPSFASLNAIFIEPRIVSDRPQSLGVLVHVAARLQPAVARLIGMSLIRALWRFCGAAAIRSCGGSLSVVISNGIDAIPDSGKPCRPRRILKRLQSRRDIH
jgi:hypothetical protein